MNRLIAMVALLVSLSGCHWNSKHYRDRFSDLHNWRAVGGSWTAGNGQLSLRSPVSADRSLTDSPFAYFEASPALRNFAIELDVRHPVDGAIWLRTDAARTHATLLGFGGPEPGKLYWRRVAWGHISSPVLVSDRVFRPGQPNLHLRVLVENETETDTVYVVYAEKAEQPATRLRLGTLPHDGFVGVSTGPQAAGSGQAFANLDIRVPSAHTRLIPREAR